jgi:hypothetical protein
MVMTFPLAEVPQALSAYRCEEPTPLIVTLTGLVAVSVVPSGLWSDTEYPDWQEELLAVKELLGAVTVR